MNTIFPLFTAYIIIIEKYTMIPIIDRDSIIAIEKRKSHILFFLILVSLKNNSQITAKLKYIEAIPGSPNGLYNLITDKPPKENVTKFLYIRYPFNSTLNQSYRSLSETLVTGRKSHPNSV